MHSHIIFEKLLTVNFTELSNYNCLQKDQQTCKNYLLHTQPHTQAHTQAFLLQGRSLGMRLKLSS